MPFTAIYEAPTAARLAKLIDEGLPASSDKIGRRPAARVQGGEVSGS